MNSDQANRAPCAEGSANAKSEGTNLVVPASRRLTLSRRTILLGAAASALFAAGCSIFNTPARSGHSRQVIKRLAFGSCAQQERNQPIWDKISAANPDLFVFIGDNIYGDTEDMLLMKKKYVRLASKPEFARFRSQVPIVATWDDHDYGVNDGGREYPQKEESKRLMLDFFREPQGSERRMRPGVYTSYTMGPPGRVVQLILLDLRWFRGPLVYDAANDAYLPDKTGATMLGAEQWAWLEAELRKPADLRIIASSTQFSSPDHRFEKWANFPGEKQKMLALLDRLRINNAVVISGDMHFGELSSEKTPQGVTLYDLTSSGLNFFEVGAHYPNRNRMAIHDKSPNFGFIEIDWDRSTPKVSLQVRDDAGAIAIRQDVQF